MGGFRALTKHHNDSSHQRRRPYQKRTHADLVKQEATQQPDLNLLGLTPAQETTKAVKFVFEELPTTKSALDTLILEELKSEEHILIGLRRLRDYFNPSLTGEAKEEGATERFNRFVHAMLLSWLDLAESEDKNTRKQGKAVAKHLKELSGSVETCPTIVAYLSSQMNSLSGLLQTLRDIESEDRDVASVKAHKDRMFPKFAKSLLRIQRIFIDVLESPMGRLMDCMIALSTQTYQIFAETLTEEVDAFIKMAKHDLKLMKAQKATNFNPTLISLSVKLANSDNEEARDLSARIGQWIYDTSSNPQIVCAELSQHIELNIEGKRPRLEYLQLARQKPKPIPTYAPFIDPDFLVAGHFKQRQKTDVKVIKGKLKKADKDAQRELKKDTMAIMQERQRQKDAKKNTHSQKVFRGGNHPKDEI